MKIRQIVQERLDETLGKDNYRLIVVAITGSHAYGMQKDTSDYDVHAVFLPNEDYILGIKTCDQVKIPKQKMNKTEVEGMAFSFNKWYNLVYAQNPNVIELLWHEPSMYVYRDDIIWPMLMATRDEMLSKKAKHSFAGYAHAQFERLDKLNEKVNQNKERLAEFEKYGYSTKNASHLFRLMNTCVEILTEHRINVMRPERQMLISIREGKYPLDEIRSMVARKEDLITEAYIRSDLRKQVDPEFANDLKIQILRRHLSI